MGAATDLQDLARAVRNPGRLCLGPTAVSGAFPFGGLSVGLHRGAELVLAGRIQETEDATNGQLLEVARRSIENLWIDLVIDGPGWDEDLLQYIYSKTNRSSTLASQYPAETQIVGGGDATTLTPLPPLLFAAEDALKGDSAYILRPVAIGLGLGIAFARSKKAGMPIRIKATGVKNRDPWQVSRLANVVL